MKFIDRFKHASRILRGQSKTVDMIEAFPAGTSPRKGDNDSQLILDAIRQVTESIDIGTGQVGLFGGLLDEGRGLKYNYEEVTLKDLKEMDLQKLIPKVIKSDPAIDQSVDFFTTLITQQASITSENDRAEREIQELNEIFEERNNPLSLNIAHCASSLIMRGDILAETEFDENAEPINFWVNDPVWVEWRLISSGNTSRWAMGQYSKGTWQEIDTPNVFYLSGNPLVGERSSRAPLQTALFPALSQTGMIKSLQSILDIHAWAQTLFKYKKLELLELSGNENVDMDKSVNQQITEGMNLIKLLGKKKPDQIMGITDDIEPVEMPGGGDKLTWTEGIGRLYDKRVAAGSKTPATIGGQQQRADYSTRQQNLFYSVYLQSGQENIQKTLEWGYKRFLISRGITEDPVFTTKSVNVEARLIESEAFQEMMSGLYLATQAGLSLPIAIELFEAESGQSLPGELKQKILEDHEELKDRQNTMEDRQRSNDENNDEGDDEDENEEEDRQVETDDANFIAEILSNYSREKTLKRLIPKGKGIQNGH